MKAGRKSFTAREYDLEEDYKVYKQNCCHLEANLLNVFLENDEKTKHR